MMIGNFGRACVVLCMVYVCGWVTAQTSDDIKRLKKRLLVDSGYDKDIRPVVNQSHVVQVEILMGIKSILDFDLTSGRLEAFGYFITRWNDEHLTWNETEFPGVRYIRVPPDAIWTPTLIQRYGVQEEDEVRDVTQIIVHNNGNVTWLIRERMNTFCEVGVLFYPMDKHACEFQVYTEYTISELNFLSLDSVVETDYLKPHGQWEVAKTNAYLQINTFKHSAEASSFYIGSVSLDRRSTFPIIHFGIPLVLMTLATFFVHAVPLTSGERISFSVTLFLAFVFWQVTLSENLPQDSSEISLLSIMITVSMSFSVIATIMSVMLCRMSVEQFKPIPKMLYKLAERRIQKQLAACSVAPIEYKRDENAQTEEPAAETKVTQRKPKFDVTWLVVADSIDMLLFYGVLVIQIAIFVGLCIMYGTHVH